MFLRILWRLLSASRGRLALALVAVASGATVCAALFNLDLDATEKLTREFRSLGANVVLSPQQSANDETLDAAVLEQLAGLHLSEVVAAAPYLYISAQAGDRVDSVPVIVAGTNFDEVARMNSWWKVDGLWVSDRDARTDCMVGQQAAKQLGLAVGTPLRLRYGSQELSLHVAGVVTSGSSEDNQVFISLPLAQQLSSLTGRVSLVQLSVRGTPPVIEDVIRRLSAALTGLTVQPVRQLAAAEGRLLDRIRGLLFGTVLLILVLTSLSVLATTAGLALERRRDVGLMKALGGSVPEVMHFFQAEALVIGLTGGIVGSAGGMLLSDWIGERVFATAIAPRLIVVPMTLVLMIIATLAGALPLRLLGRVRPSEILRDK